MECPSPDRVLDYVSRRAVDRDELDAHFDTCGECRAMLAELARSEFVAPVESDVQAIGRYRITERLGAGGMGTVYAAVDPHLDRKVAIKLVHPELAGRGLERLVNEGRVLAKLSHPNVVVVHDAGRDGDQLYVAMELVDGVTLGTWLRETRRSTREILAKIVDAGRGIAAAHAVGVVHRDVKPENILIDRTGHAKVADFGLAQSLDDAGRSGIGGTPAFMSPEQWAGAQVGPASDQYSLAAVLEMALEGRVPRWLRARIARAKAEAPADRYPSITAFIRAIDPARRTRRAVVLASALLVIAGVSTGVVFARRSDPFVDTCEAIRSPAWWTPIQQIPVEHGILAAGETADTWERFSAAVSRSQADEARIGVKLCEQRPESAATRQTFELATACLARHRTQFARLFDRVRTLDRKDGPMAVQWIHDISSPEECGYPAMLNAEVAARRTGPLLVERVMGQSLMRSAIREERYHESIAAERDGAAALAVLRPFGGTILAIALLDYAKVASAVKKLPALEPEIREAIALADAAHADNVRALATVRLIEMYAHNPGKEQAALDNEGLARAALTAGHMEQGLGCVLDAAVGYAHMQLGHNDLALAAFDKANATVEAVVSADDPRVPEYAFFRALALGKLGRIREAERAYTQTYERAQRAFGPDAPGAAIYEVQLALAHMELKRCDLALRELDHARHVLAGQVRADGAQMRTILETEGSCYARQKNFAAATAAFETYLASLKAAHHEHTPEMAEILGVFGELAYEQHDYATAIEKEQAGEELLEELVGPNDWRVSAFLADIGKAQVAAHDPRAQATLERAMKLVPKSAPIRRAKIDATYARALYPTEPARAKALANLALETLEKMGAVGADDVAEIKAWQATHK
ncbi:MAG: serine/threonine-protein kinase [Kofleriaceae bacterium]